MTTLLLLLCFFSSGVVSHGKKVHFYGDLEASGGEDYNYSYSYDDDGSDDDGGDYEFSGHHLEEVEEEEMLSEAKKSTL